MVMSGKNLSTAALICAIISLVFALFGGLISMLLPAIAVAIPLIGLVLGIVGIVMSVNAKKNGCTDGMQKAALVIAIIGTILNGISFAACVLCAAACGAVFGELGGTY